jgi:hypothetical protein
MTPAIDLHDVRVMCSNGRNVTYYGSINLRFYRQHLIDPDNVIPFSAALSGTHEFSFDCKWGSCCSIFSFLCSDWYIIQLPKQFNLMFDVSFHIYTCLIFLHRIYFVPLRKWKVWRYPMGLSEAVNRQDRQCNGLMTNAERTNRQVF